MGKNTVSDICRQTKTNATKRNGDAQISPCIPSHIHKMVLRLAQLEAGQTYMIAFTPIPGGEPTWSIIGSGKIENCKQVANKS